MSDFDDHHQSNAQADGMFTIGVFTQLAMATDRSVSHVFAQASSDASND